MSDWFYIKKGQRQGPVSETEIKQLLERGDILPQTKVWTAGRNDWQPLEDSPEFHDAADQIPPPIPASEAADPPPIPTEAAMAAQSAPPVQAAQPDSLNKPWSRFFSRVFDLFWETMVVGAVLITMLGDEFTAHLHEDGTLQAFGLLCLPIALFLDAIIYRIFGNTLGRALIGLHVSLKDGSPLNFGQYISRNYAMWFMGLALGFPLLNLVTMGWQYSRIRKGEPASYDVNTGHQVTAKPTNLMRYIIFTLIFLVLLFIYGAFLAGKAYQPRCEVTARETHWDTFIIDGKFDAGVIVAATIRNNGYAGAIKIRATLDDPAVGTLERVKTVHLDSATSTTVKFSFHEPTIQSEDLTYRITCSP